MYIPDWTKFAKQLEELLGSDVVAEVLDEKRAVPDEWLAVVLK